MVRQFNKQVAEHEIRTMKLTHGFALQMAIIICLTVVSSVILLGILFGAVTPIAITIIVIIAIIFGVISFSFTRSSLV